MTANRDLNVNLKYQASRAFSKATKLFLMEIQKKHESICFLVDTKLLHHRLWIQLLIYWWPILNPSSTVDSYFIHRWFVLMFNKFNHSLAAIFVLVFSVWNVIIKSIHCGCCVVKIFALTVARALLFKHDVQCFQSGKIRILNVCRIWLSQLNALLLLQILLGQSLLGQSMKPGSRM